MTASETRRAIDAVWRIEAPRLIAGLTRIVRDVGQVDALRSEPALQGYHLLPSVRGDLLFKLGRLAEAREEFHRAASLTRNERERKLLLERAEACV